MEQRKTCGKRKSADGLHVHGPKNKKTRSWITGYPSQSSGGAAGRGKALRRGRVNPVAAVAVGLVGLGCNDYSGGAAGWPWPGLQVSSFGRRVLLLPGRPKHASVIFSPAEEAQVPRPCLVPNPACPLDVYLVEEAPAAFSSAMILREALGLAVPGDKVIEGRGKNLHPT